ncbi:MAG: zinc-ribbon domain-containing protein [Sandaracinaceae bacterium]|nr:zinc-ribbon domain-containing protein [Sandaracinaceae bacterium]
MKFLCPQCKAKYQIADEKIDGRTLRMKCRRCEHEILVRGDGTIGGASEPAPAPTATREPTHQTSAAGRLAAPNIAQTSRTGSQVGPTPQRSPSMRPSMRAPAPTSALGADFRRQAVAAPQSPASQRAPASTLDQWHVSIQDVPVGPMKRDELARKIGAGAVTGDSLCWREGYDDWRPLKDVAELSPLLRRSAPPPAAAPRPGVSAPRPGTRPSGPTAPRPPLSRTPSSAGGRAAPMEARPAARSNVVPIGGRLGASAAPSMDELDSFDDTSDPTRIAANPFDESGALATPGTDAPAVDNGSFPPIAGMSLPPAAGGSGEIAFASIPPAAVPRPAPVPRGAAAAMAPMASPSSPSLPPVYVDRRRGGGGLPVGAWIAIVGSGCFGIALAVVIGSKLMVDKPAQVVVQAPVDTSARLPEATVDLNLQPTSPTSPTSLTSPTSPATPEAVAGSQANDNGGRRPAGGGAAAPAQQAAAPSGRQLSAAEQAELDRMAGGSTTFRPVGGANNRDDDAPRTGGGEMTAEQLRAVVNRERSSSQHCYEMAARQTGSQDTMRVNVHFVASAVGRVTEVTATGPVDSLNRCMEAAIRRWHFSGAGEAALPFVFSPGN